MRSVQIEKTCPQVPKPFFGSTSNLVSFPERRRKDLNTELYERIDQAGWTLHFVKHEFQNFSEIRTKISNTPVQVLRLSSRRVCVQP